MDDTIEREIRSFGKDIFAGIGSEQPSTFNKEYWSSRLMEWSMTRPRFKINLFRLIDVLPTLPTAASVAAHIQEYLAADATEINSFLGWLFRLKKRPIRGRIASFITKKSVHNMSDSFIAGDTPERALPAIETMRTGGISFTVDLLGEYCVSEVEALAYLNRYLEVLSTFQKELPRFQKRWPLIEGHPGEASPICISVKLSALYSQCSILNYDKTVAVLSERLSIIMRKAREINAQVYVDAEDAGYNPMIYAAYKQVFGSDEFRTVAYPGIVVQAYAKEAQRIIEDLLAFAKQRGTPIAIRLVKGAYWDQETISAAQNHWPSPLFAHKESSDANFELLTRLLMDNHSLVLPAIASHNIRSLSHACCYAKAQGLTNKQFELQMLYGMAAPIANAFAKKGYLVRLYTPIGEILPGMGYLVRRLLENTSNESFLRHTFFEHDEIDSLLQKPTFKEPVDVQERSAA